MQLYFIPFACSLAARAVIHELGATAEFIRVKDQRLPDGSDFRAVNPMGYVPVLRIADGTLLTEGPAILQYLADLQPERRLAPPAGTLERLRLQQWLNFLGAEVHKFVFTPLMGQAVPAPVKAYALDRARGRFDLLAAHLAGREFLLDEFSVADAYLLAILNWCETGGVPLERWPVLSAWRAKLRQRPSIAKAMQEEWPLLKAA